MSDMKVERVVEPTEAMIEAGEAVLEKADEDLRNYVSGITPDWDYGMEAEAVWKAMEAVRLATPATAGDAAGEMAREDVPETMLDQCAICDRPRYAHNGIELFCPMIATYRALRRPAMGGEVARMQGVREELRVLMLEQPISGKRETYSDGFASGLAHAIRHIDSVIDPKLERLSTSGEGFAEGIEAAAKVAAGWQSSLSPGSLDRRFGHEEAARGIAGAIRALTATTPPDKVIEGEG